MGIGYLLLYAALAVVALWLVAEVLLQNRAPLHWRVLALVGFLGVAAGMSLGSVVVIGAGAALFAVGQTFVTLSVKRGYRNGWSLRNADGSLPGPLAKVPLLGALTGGGAAAAVVVAEERVGEVSAVEEPPAAAQSEPEELPEVEQTAAFEMQELAQDGVYASSYYEQPQPHQQQVQDPYGGAYQGGYDQQQWQTQQQTAYGYDQSYGAYPQQQSPQQPDPYGNYQQQDQYAGYQQEQLHQQAAWDPNPQQHEHQHQHQQWQPQPDPQAQGVPQQPAYDQNYGYQQQNTWQQ
ncbi:hypothetical protein [Streptomyces sp. 1331.2]|uniref:hypothetical protein n=1 Tax=Streptomyces sp. 1331.2 TaxID=1938835 RepID=UPI000BCB472C|nr:hypothetical protein [Streptomyces sp. 1331.2]SOB84581.1 hypothetical protein SAMN06272789_4837 [Streptomyces sp. 1331.2]